jgi:hypothetical protein
MIHGLRATIIATLAALLTAPSALAQGAAEPTDIWMTQAGDARSSKMQRRHLQ